MTAILSIFGVKRLVRRGGVACVDDDRALPNVAVGRPRGPARRSVPSAWPGSRKRCKVPSFCIGRAFLPWIIRTRYGPQPEEKAAWSLHVEAPGGSPHG